MSDEESTITTASNDSTTVPTTTTTTANEPDKSPLKLFPRLVKRSTSIDITPVKQQQQQQTTDSSPLPPPSSSSSDPWRFFSDIKGKITRSVEDKITEIKSRNSDDNGSLLSSSSSKQLKDNSSSLSDSEEVSESSLSRTCGLLSTTTEGVEMSTDDEINDDDDDDDDNDDDDEDNIKNKLIKKRRNLRQRFKLLKTNTTTINKQNNNNNNITINNLTKLYNINTDRIEQALPEIEDNAISAVDDDGIENAVEAIEDEYDKQIINAINENYDNITIDKDNLIKIKQVQGSDLNEFHDNKTTTVFAPVGFVDMRNNNSEASINNNNNNNNKRFNINLIKISVISVIYLLLYYYSSYWSGVLFGIITTHLFITIKQLLSSSSSNEGDTQNSLLLQQQQQQNEPTTLKNIIEIEPIEEYQPLKKHEGWVNELPEFYDPHTYHINKTQSVYLRLQGNLLRISHTRMKISKRALWNEREISKPLFTHHRIYNLLNAKIQLLPKGLAKKRHWSKKYPICVVLTTTTTTTTDQINFENDQQQHEDDDLLKTNNNNKKLSISQQFSKLAADDDNSEHSHASSTPPSPLTTTDLTEQSKKFDFDIDEDVPSVMPETWSSTIIIDDNQQQYETKLYIFGRTDREKEEWFRRLQLAATAATTTTYTNPRQSSLNNDNDLLRNNNNDDDEVNYLKYMQYFNKNLQINDDDFDKIKDNATTTSNKPLLDEYCLNNILWINTLFGRILYDCFYNNNLDFTQKIKERIQRKLTTIKLPYFIEEILISELKLGHTPPIIHKAKKPVINERGLWIDLDVTYEGLIVLILQTKLNLMKLKHPHVDNKNIDEKSAAMFNSDLDDSAESSSDDNLTTLTTEPQPLLDQTTTITTTTNNSNNPGGSSSSSSKKFMRMVDKIAESKLFQAAAENRLIKKAMENVSNTDLSLRCELKQLIGTLVINIPTPPSDRLWIGFQPLPTIQMKAQPIVGETNITFMRITGWIEKKLLQEFHKVLVLPNMEDLVIPVMTPKVIE